MTPNPGCTGSRLDSSWMFEDDEASWSTSSDDNSSDDGESGSLIAELPPTNSDEDDGDGDDDEDDSQTPSSELAETIRGILSHISRAGLTLGSFLHAVSWGDAGCVRDPQIRAARTALMNSPELPVILKNWWMPPRQKHGYGCTHAGPGCGYHTGAGVGQHWGTRAKTRTHGHGYSHPCVDVDYIT